MSFELPGVLLVDDFDANLLSLEATLSDLPCTLVLAKSGNEALKQLLKREFAVVLLDVQMPEMDGFEVARYVGENPDTRDVPIIFMTAMNLNEESVLKGYGSGAVDYLIKPIDPNVLRSKVRVFIELYNNRRRLAAEIESHKKTLREFEQANAALRHFTHAASHDLREPVRVMNGFLGALGDEAGEQLNASARHYLERSMVACRRMATLLDALLTYARLQRPPVWGEVDSNALVERLRMDLGERLAESQGTIEAARLPKVRGDGERLYQLLLNLVSNAVKFRRADEPPHVVISAEVRPGEPPLFCVADNGIGVPPEHRETIFDAFERLHGRDTYEGTGLGLTICRQIVEQHGGRIWVESNEGPGARFFFQIGS